MPSGDEEGSSALGALSHNWRSALVVNGLFDALEESERQRDELAQNLRLVTRWMMVASLWRPCLLQHVLLHLQHFVQQSSFDDRCCWSRRSRYLQLLGLSCVGLPAWVQMLLACVDF